MTTAWRKNTLQYQGYSPELDLVVTGPRGCLVAFCIGWIREMDGVLCGQIEPLGVHQAYRGQGLGKAILSEGLRRLYGMGVNNIFVETDLFRDTALTLYETLGFQVIRDVLVFRKDY
jgi:ribosomal protein S18 acetylase RimI-like enzyme